MPYEVVQYPRTDTTDGTEVSVHWSKQGNGDHVQLKVQRHVWGATLCPNGCTERNAQVEAENATLKKVPGSILLASYGCSDCPPMQPKSAVGGDELCSVGPAWTNPIPIGSVKVSDDGRSIARKMSQYFDGSQPDQWAVWCVPDEAEISDLRIVADAQVLDWSLVWVPDHGVVPVEVLTDQLDRDEINQLVRALRKARDQAYGADA